MSVRNKGEERNPLDEIEDSPVWDRFREVMHLDRINLADLWRTAGRPHLSPRRWAKMYHYLDEVEFTGTKPDSPVWGGIEPTMNYIQHLDFKIMDAVGKAFMQKIRQNPARMLLECSDDSFCGMVTASLASVAAAEDGDKTSAAKTVMADVVAQTEHLDIYAQETAVAKVQRAFIEAKKIRTGRVIDGEFMEDQ